MTWMVTFAFSGMLDGSNTVICSLTDWPLVAVAGDVRSKVGVGVITPVSTPVTPSPRFYR